MKSSECTELSKRLTEFVFRAYYTFKDETREFGNIAVGSHAFSVMMKIYYSDKNYSVNGLADSMHMRNPQLSKLLNGLEDHGYITRIRPRENRRSVEISLTDCGREYIENMLSIVQKSIESNLESSSLDGASASKMVRDIYSAVFSE